MHRRLLQVLTLGVCLGLLPAAAYAKGGKGGGPPAGKGKGASERGFKDKDRDRDRHHEDNDRDEHRAGRGHGHEAAVVGPSSRPPGWDKGKKTGWGDCNVPPGLAKKRGCDSGGFSARERAVRRHRTTTVSHAPLRTTTTRSARGGSATTTTTSKATQARQSRTIILQREGGTRPIVRK